MKRIFHTDPSLKFYHLVPTVYRSYPRIIYVIELSPKAAADPAFATANPGYVAGECYYIGSSSKSARDRFADHMTGCNASRIVRQFGVNLRYDLMPPQKPIPKNRALEQEKRLARALRAMGFGVWQH